MMEPVFTEEMDMLIEGLMNVPSPIVLHLLANEGATLKELEDLFDEESKRFVLDWVRRMITHFAVVRFYYPAKDEATYELTPFAKDMIEHINNFRVVTKGRET